jgi:hypothetical protein
MFKADSRARLKSATVADLRSYLKTITVLRCRQALTLRGENLHKPLHDLLIYLPKQMERLIDSPVGDLHQLNVII